MPATDYHLNWRNFHFWVAESVKNLFEDQNFTNVTLVSDDLQQFKAHKVVLSSSSPFFETILRSNSNPHPLLYLKGINSETLSLVMRFVYEGEVSVPQELVNSFMMTANDIKIKGLNLEAFESSKQEESTKKKEADRLNLYGKSFEENFHIDPYKTEKPINNSQSMESSQNVEYKLEVLQEQFELLLQEEDPILPQNLPSEQLELLQEDDPILPHNLLA